MVLAHKVSEKIRTKDIQILQDVSFDTMLLSTKTLEGLKNSGFFKPSPVQLHGIPMGKCGFDLLLEAKSGTGKTAVFTVIALEKIDLSLGLQAVILSPTREIAAQICDVIKQIGSAYTGLCVEVVMGGLPVLDDIEKFSKNNVHIVVGSPGRLKHLIQDKHIDVSAVRLFVLDEADKLMEKSFLIDIKCINSNLPQQKQVIMSSATYPESCKEFLNQFVHGAQHICPENNSVLLGVSQKVTYVKYNSNIVKQTKFRFEELVKILSNLSFKQCLIFCNYQARVAELHRMLKKADWPVEMLHGQQDQHDRLGALKTLQEYKCRILISTDLASRGIDASNIDLVINFEPPYEWQTYLHRIGRAGRFGSYGTAITIVSEGNEQKKFIALFKSLNSSVILSDFWNGSNIVECVLKHEEKSQCKNSSSDTNNMHKSTDTNEQYQHSPGKIGEYHSLLFTESQQPEKIESFEDLLHSYEEFNPTDTKDESTYTCIELPTISLTEAVFQPDPTSLNQEDLAVVTKKISDDVVTEVKQINLSQNSNKEYFNSEVIYDNEDFVKLGLPTEFSSSKNKNINYSYDEVEINNNNKAKQQFSQKQSYTRNSNVKHTKTHKQKELDNRNLKMGKDNNKRGKSSTIVTSANELLDENLETFYCRNKLENNYNKNKLEHRFGNTQGKTKHYKNGADKTTGVANDYDRDSYSSTSSNSYCDSYAKWYKQLKLRTKQIELSLYINELTSIR